MTRSWVPRATRAATVAASDRRWTRFPRGTHPNDKEDVLATGGRRRDARRGPLRASPGRRLTSGREKRGSPSGAVWNGTFARVNNVPEEHAPARLWSSRSSVQPPLPLQALLRPLRRPRRWSDARSALEYQDAGTLVRIQRLHNELRVKLENQRGIPKHDRKRSDGNRSEPESETNQGGKLPPRTAMLVGRETFGRED